MGDPSLAQADVDSMSLRDLKQLITMAGLTLDGCLERPDLRQRAREAQAALAAGAAEAAAPKNAWDRIEAFRLSLMMDWDAEFDMHSRNRLFSP